MDIKMQQAYYQQMRQQQVYRAYVAGIGSDPTPPPPPPPTTYKFKVETEDDPPATLTITIDGEEDSWDFNVQKPVLEGKTVEYKIVCTDPDARPIVGINGEPVDPAAGYDGSVEMTEDKTITVTFGAAP